MRKHWARFKRNVRRLVRQTSPKYDRRVTSSKSQEQRSSGDTWSSLEEKLNPF